MSNTNKAPWGIRTDDDTRKGITGFAELHKRPIGYLVCVMFRRMAGLPEVSYEAWRERMKDQGNKEHG